MARILASGAGAAAFALGPSWLFGLCMFVVSVWVVSFAVFICGRRSHDDRPRKKPPPPAAKASRGSARSGSVADTTGMYAAAYVGAGAAACGCSGGHGGHGGGGCGGGGHGGGGGGGCGGGGC